MIHHFPYLHPKLYYYGLRYFVYRKDRLKALLVHLLWFITPPFVFGQFFFGRYLDSIGERSKYALINTPDWDYSVASIVILVMVWPFLWIICGRIGDRWFLQRNKWAKYNHATLDKSRRMHKTVKMPEWF